MIEEKGLNKLVKKGYIRWVHPLSYVVHFCRRKDIEKGEYLRWGKAVCGVEVEYVLGSSHPVVEDLYCKRCMNILKKEIEDNDL